SMTTTDGLAPPSGSARPTAVGGSSELRRRRRRADNLRGWLYCLPFLADFVLFLIWPTIYAFWMSLSGVRLSGTKTGFVGVGNVAQAVVDPYVWSCLRNTVWVTVRDAVRVGLVALVVSVQVNVGLPGDCVGRLSFFLPYLPASTVASQFWVCINNPQLGM